MDIKVNITPYEKEDSKVKAFANVVLGDCFAVNGIKVMEGSKGLFLSYPNYKSGDDYKNYCNPTTAEMRTKIETAVMEQYNEKTQALTQSQNVQRGR